MRHGIPRRLPGASPEKLAAADPGDAEQATLLAVEVASRLYRPLHWRGVHRWSRTRVRTSRDQAGREHLHGLFPADRILIPMSTTPGTGDIQLDADGLLGRNRRGAERDASGLTGQMSDVPSRRNPVSHGSLNRTTTSAIQWHDGSFQLKGSYFFWRGNGRRRMDSGSRRGPNEAGSGHELQHLKYG